MERLGLVKLQVKLVRKDEELISIIMQKRGLTEEKKDSIAEMLRYNILTVEQFADLTGLAVSSITNKTRPSYKDDVLITELDYCYPYSSLKKDGPKFVVRNEKAERYLKG